VNWQLCRDAQFTKGSATGGTADVRRPLLTEEDDPSGLPAA